MAEIEANHEGSENEKLKIEEDKNLIENNALRL